MTHEDRIVRHDREPIPTTTREIHLPEKDYGLPPIVAAKFRAMSPEWLATILPTEPETGTP